LGDLGIDIMYNIKNALRESGCKDANWTEQAQNRVSVNTVMYVQIPKQGIC